MVYSGGCSVSVLAMIALHLAGCSAAYRLPSTVTPLNYMLRLEPDLDNNTVSGVVMIELITTSNAVSTWVCLSVLVGVKLNISGSSPALTINFVSVHITSYGLDVPQAKKYSVLSNVDWRVDPWLHVPFHCKSQLEFDQTPLFQCQRDTGIHSNEQ